MTVVSRKLSESGSLANIYCAPSVAQIGGFGVLHMEPFSYNNAITKG